MLTIWKFPLNGPRETIVLDHSAEVLDVQYQDGQLVLWALVDTERSAIGRVFEVFGTGWELPFCPGKRTHIGTVQNGGLVLHVFERR